MVNIAKSTIDDIVENKTKLQTFLTEIQAYDYIKRHIIRRANLEELDKTAHLWFIRQCCKGISISCPLLMEKCCSCIHLSTQTIIILAHSKLERDDSRGLKIGME